MRNFHHIAYWTNDLDAAMAQATRLLGVGPFQVLEHVDLGDFRFRGEPATLDHSAAFAAWGPVLLELDQVHEVRPAALREAWECGRARSAMWPGPLTISVRNGSTWPPPAAGC
jgi:hypothetical protein